MQFLGKTVDYWVDLEQRYEAVRHILETDEGKRLLLLGKIKKLTDSIDVQYAQLKDLKQQLAIYETLD
jgi:hypothetical protein